MSELLYNTLWNFTLRHRDDVVANPEKTPVSIITQLYEREQITPRLEASTPDKWTIINDCINDAITYGTIC